MVISHSSTTAWSFSTVRDKGILGSKLKYSMGSKGKSGLRLLWEGWLGTQDERTNK